MINRVVIVGRTTKDPELRSTTSGKKVTSVTVAVDNLTKNADGSKSTSFIPVTAWNNSAEFLTKYAKKGSLVGVEGRITQRSYKRNDGTNASVVEVIADNITLLGSKGARENNANNGFEPDQESDVVADLESTDLADDDLPF